MFGAKLLHFITKLNPVVVKPFGSLLPDILWLLTWQVVGFPGLSLEKLHGLILFKSNLFLPLYKVLSLYTTCHLFPKNHRILIYARLRSHQVLILILILCLFVCSFAQKPWVLMQVLPVLLHYRYDACSF